MKKCPVCNTTFEDEELFCANCGTKLPDAVTASVSAPPAGTGKTKRKLSAANTIILVFVLIATVGAAAYSYTQMGYYKEQAGYYESKYDSEYQQRCTLEQALNDAQETLSDVQMALDSAEAELEITQGNSAANLLQSQQNAERADAAEKEMDTLLGKLKRGYGFGSQNYYAEQGVLVLSKSGGSKSIGIFFGISGTAYTHKSGSGISCEWGKFVNSRSALTIKPITKGYYTITFTNNQNDDTFDVLVIVTD